MVTGLVLIQNIMFVLLGILIGGYQMAQTYATANANSDGVATATFTFGDTEFNDVNDGTITLVDHFGGSVTFTISNDYSATLTNHFNAGGNAGAAAANFIGAVNATVTGFGDADGIVATNPSGGVIVLTAGIEGSAGNTTITYAADFENTLESGYATAFTGGAAGNEDGATVLHGGNVDSTNTVTNSKTLRGSLDASAVYGSRVTAITGTKHKPGVQTSKGSGALAYQPAASDPQFLLRGYSGKINNVSSTVLQIAGADAAGRGERGVVKTHKYNISSIAYNTGFATKGGTAGDVSNFVKSDGTTAASDEALETSRAIPGELVFHIGAKLPTQADYSTKTGG